ncbi:protein kinase domain-containing protein [Streptomyces tritici]|uniref:serine/threonine-protein kinase n=1 Tax=Streptomyces tritici TaxID=2054410 RepID=UPI003AF16E4D
MERTVPEFVGWVTATRRQGVLVAGRVLARRYELRQLLGRGGMGEVWAADDRRLQRRVAVKVIPDHASSQEMLDLFFREARTAGGLSHPGVVTVYDLGQEDDGAVFLVMELVSGRDLRSVLRQDGPPEPADAVDWIAQVADALAATHAAGVVHRDLKPDNLMLTGSGRVKILDFGIARYLSTVTMASRVIGTPAYMPPERLKGKTGDGRSDLYSLGCVLHELLTGRTPFGVLDYHAQIFAHISETPEPPSALRPGLPAALDRLVADLLAKDPDLRPASAAELRDRLRTCLAPAPGDGRDAAGGARTADPADLEARGQAATAGERWSEAAALYAELAEYRAQALGEAHADTVDARYHHAWALGKSGRHAEAVPLLNRAVGDLTRVKGPEHPTTLTARHHLTWNLGKAGRHAEAARQYGEFVDAYVRVCGRDNSDTLAARYDRGWNLSKAERHAEALLVFDDVLPDLTRVKGAEHPDTLAARHDQAWSLGQTDRHAEAAQRYDSFMRAYIRVRGPEHEDVLAARPDHAWNLGKCGRHAEAVREYEDFIEAFLRVRGPEHPKALIARHDYAWNLGKSGRHAEAAAEYESFLDAYLRMRGPDHGDSLSARHDHGWNLGRSGRHAEAARLLAAAAPDFARVKGPEHPETLAVRHDLAWNLGQTGRHEEAVREYDAIMDAYVRARGADHQDVRGAFQEREWNRARLPSRSRMWWH